MSDEDAVPVSPEIAKLQEAEVIRLSDIIFMFPDRTIGQHGNVYEGEVRSSVYGIRPCVIKFAELSEQNVKEAEILTKLGSHTNVIAIIQSGTYCDVFEERVYIALDKCHHENLRQYLAHRRTVGIEFDLNQAIDFAKQIVVGVMYIHENNVIHLDLKPSNILISQNLRLIKIADFGLSIVVKSPKSKVFHRHQFGTNGYRPIESFGNGEVSMRTDIFSLGTVLLHLLSNGNDVFGLDEHTFTRNIMNDVTDTSGLLVCNPVTTEHLIKCMVSKERCRRPSIWEVSDHPCWTGEEVECEFEYQSDGEINDSAVHERNMSTEDIKSIRPTSSSPLARQREFLEKMREMGFNRKPTIVVFDLDSKYLYRFDHRNNSMTIMHEYPYSHSFFRAVPLDEYIYVFYADRSMYRLEYGDITATWTRMTDWIGDEDILRFHAIASSNAIYLLSPRPGTNATSCVYRYDPRMDKWEELKDTPTTATYKFALHCNDKFFYCIGSYDNRQGVKPSCLEVGKLNLKTLDWTRVCRMNQEHDGFTATETNGTIYVVDKRNTVIYIEKYDPIADTWTEMDPIKCDYVGRLRATLATDNKLFFVGFNTILQFDLGNNQLSVVASRSTMFFQHAVLVKMSP